MKRCLRDHLISWYNLNNFLVVSIQNDIFLQTRYTIIVQRGQVMKRPFPSVTRKLHQTLLVIKYAKICENGET